MRREAKFLSKDATREKTGLQTKTQALMEPNQERGFFRRRASEIEIQIANVSAQGEGEVN